VLSPGDRGCEAYTARKQAARVQLRHRLTRMEPGPREMRASLCLSDQSACRAMCAVNQIIFHYLLQSLNAHLPAYSTFIVSRLTEIRT